MNLIEFNRAVVDEVEKITRDISWPEIVGVQTIVADTAPYYIKKTFVVSLETLHCRANHALTEAQVETASVPIIAYTVDRLFDQLRVAETNRSGGRHARTHIPS